MMDLPLGTARDAGLVLALSAVDSFFTVRYFNYEIMGAFHFLISLALTVSAITCYRAYQKQPDPTHPLVPMAASNYSDSVAEWAPMIGYASCLWSFVTVHLQTRLEPVQRLLDYWAIFDHSAPFMAENGLFHLLSPVARVITHPLMVYAYQLATVKGILRMREEYRMRQKAAKSS